jgi:hypothetical protein
MTQDDEYRWWRDKLERGSFAPDPINDDPQCGFYLRRLVKRGPYVTAHIWLEDGELRCEVDGREVDPVEQWSYLADNPITEGEYYWREALARHARHFEPRDPLANPRKPIDHLQTPIRFLDNDERDPDT